MSASTVGPTLSTDAELAAYPPDVQQSIRNVEQAQLDRFNRAVNDYSHSERTQRGHVIHYAKDGAIMDEGAIHTYFGLSYASWLCLPRIALQEMPPDWQAKFVALLEEAEEKHKMAVPEGLVVMRRAKNRFVSNDHWNNYRRGTTTHALAIDKARGF